MRILLAEDNEDHALLTEMAMRETRPDVASTLTVTTVADGETALAYLRGEGQYAGRPWPDMVFLDIKMPGLGGLDVLREMRAAPETRALPVVILTTSGRDEDVSEAYRLGANEYVRKPASFEEFRHKIQAIPVYWSSVVTRPPHPEA